MSNHQIVMQTFEFAHVNIDAGFQAAYEAEMAGIQALYDSGPSTWCEETPPVSPDIQLADSFYSAYARHEAERVEKSSE